MATHLFLLIVLQINHENFRDVRKKCLFKNTCFLWTLITFEPKRILKLGKAEI